MQQSMAREECTEIMEVNEDHLNENKQRLFTQSLLWQGSQLPSLAFGGDQRQAGKWESVWWKRGGSSLRAGVFCAM